MDAGVISSNSKYFYGIFGFVCSFSSIFLEEKKRRGELAMYCLPIALKSAYQIAYQRKWIIHIKHFEVMMTSVAMAIIMVSCMVTDGMLLLEDEDDLFCTISLFIKKSPMFYPLLFERSCINSLERTKDSYVYIQMQDYK